MNMIELEPGMRVRCVDAYGTRLRKGREYTVESTIGDYVSVVGGARYWRAGRFKPVIRVKAKSEPVAGSNRATYSSSDLAVYSMRRLRDFAAGVHADSKP